MINIIYRTSIEEDAEILELLGDEYDDSGNTSKIYDYDETPIEKELIYAEVGPNNIKYFVRPIDKGQMWYWSQKWQEMEQEADKDFETGKTEEFNNMDDFINSL